MARKARIHVQGGVYHVMMRGNGGQDIFFTDHDRYRLYLLIQEGTVRFDYRVHAFCLMGNHIHLALQVAHTPLSKIIQNLSFRYTKWVNRQQDRTGHLFQGRYKAILIDQGSYLLELVRYIHLNPVRAGLVKQADDYPFSSHRSYLGYAPLPWLTTDWILRQFDRSVMKARQRYNAFVADGGGLTHQERFYRGKTDTRVLGDDRFLETVLGEPGRSKARLPSFQEATAMVSKAYSLSVSELKAAGRSRRAAEARALVGLIVVQLSIDTLTAAASYFGRDVSTLSTGIKRLTIKIRQADVAYQPCSSILEQFDIKLSKPDPS